MNIYSVLDDSDEENVPLKKTNPVKAGAAKKGKESGAAAPSKVKAPSNDKKGSKGENTASSTTVVGAKGRDNTRVQKGAASGGDNDDRDVEGGGKENNRGGKPRGKEPHRRGERRGNSGDGDDPSHRRPKREFDRRSGTGRGKELAKGGRGSYGAGNVNQDAQDAEKHPHEAETLLEPKGEEEERAVEEATHDEEPAEPEPVTFTLDEYMEKRNEARKEALLLSGGDKKQPRSVDAAAEFAGMKSIEGGEIDNYMPARNAKSAEIARKDQRSTSKSKVVDVGFRFESNNWNGDRGGRGGDRGDRGGRGGGGRGGERGRSGRGRGGRGGAPVTVFNNVDFPSL